MNVAERDAPYWQLIKHSFNIDIMWVDYVRFNLMKMSLGESSGPYQSSGQASKERSFIMCLRWKGRYGHFQSFIVRTKTYFIRYMRMTIIITITCECPVHVPFVTQLSWRIGNLQQSHFSRDGNSTLDRCQEAKVRESYVPSASYHIISTPKRARVRRNKSFNISAHGYCFFSFLTYLGFLFRDFHFRHEYMMTSLAEL